MFKPLKLQTLCAAILATSATFSHAELVPPEGGTWYYEIGGGKAVNVPSSTKSTLKIKGGGSFGGKYSCGNFSFKAGFKNLLNGLNDIDENVMGQLEQAATATVASLPMYVIQRANPGLYDLLKTNAFNFADKLTLATKSCEDMEKELAAGKNPYAEWLTVAKGNEWKQSMGLALDSSSDDNKDVLAVKKKVDKSAANNGVPWVGNAKCGGKNQPSCNVVSDTVKVGYNVLQERDPANNSEISSVGGSPVARLGQVWKKPDEMGQFAVDVLGEKSVKICQGDANDDCKPTSKAGRGLLPKLDEERTDVQSKFVDILSSSESPSLTELDGLSAPGIGLTHEVVSSIRNLPKAEKELAVGKLSDEIALARTIEKSLLARRALLAGRQLNEIAAVGDAQKEIQSKVSELDKEIDNLLFESRVRKEVVSSTAMVLLKHEQMRMDKALIEAPRNKTRAPLPESSAIQKD
jgi:integrating conjugative element protein (TIGR03755 family)